MAQNIRLRKISKQRTIFVRKISEFAEINFYNKNTCKRKWKYQGGNVGISECFSQIISLASVYEHI
jgi:hypothetical protein